MSSWHGSSLAKLLLILSTLLPLSTAACHDRVSNCDAAVDYFPDKPIFQDALTITKLDFMNTHVDIEIATPNTDSEQTLSKFRLIRCGCEHIASSKPPHPTTTLVSVPPTGVYADDTIILTILFTELDAADFVKAAGAIAANAYTPQIRQAAANNSFALIPGFPASLKVAGISAVADTVDVAILSQFSAPAYREALQSGATSVPFLLVAESAEETPLGRAEWIKFLGLVVGRVPKANKAYDAIKARYNALKENAFSSAPARLRRHRPSVFFNLPSNFSGTWTYPVIGGAQYMARFVSDANADYRFANDSSKTTALFTDAQVLQYFASASHWINVGFYPAKSDTTLDSLFASPNFPEQQKETWKQLAAVKCRNVWSNSKRIPEGGLGNDYFEQAVVRPDMLLDDLIAIFHPDLSDRNANNLTFYYSLSGNNPADTVVSDSCPYNNNKRPFDQPAPSGKTYKILDIELFGVTRFDVEDKLAAGELAPAIASAIDSVADEKDVEIFFVRPVADKGKGTVASLRLRVSDCDDEVDAKVLVSVLDKIFPGSTPKLLDSGVCDESAGDCQAGCPSI